MLCCTIVQHNVFSIRRNSKCFHNDFNFFSSSPCVDCRLPPVLVLVLSMLVFNAIGLLHTHESSYVARILCGCGASLKMEMEMVETVLSHGHRVVCVSVCAGGRATCVI